MIDGTVGRERGESARRVRRAVATTVAGTALLAAGAGTAVVHAEVGDLSWGDCPSAVTAVNPEGARAQCTTVSVPLDYTKPAAGKIELLVSGFLPAGKPAHRVILGNPGGPGGDAYNFWGSKGRSAKWLFDDNALIAIQPRGLEFSTPLSCSTKAACDATVAAHPDYLPNLTTANVARDMEEFRKAADLETVSYYGASWGTSLGAAFASMFPQSVDRLILDSNMNPTTIGVGGGMLGAAAQKDAFRARLSQYFEWAAANDATVKLGATPLQVFNKWNAARLSASPKAYAANYLSPAAVVQDLPQNLRPFATVILPAYNLARQTYERTSYNVRLTVGLLSGAISPSDVIAETQGPSSIMQNSTSKMYNRGQWTGFSQQIHGMAVEGKPDSAYPGSSATVGADGGKVSIYSRMGPAVMAAEASAAQTTNIAWNYFPAIFTSAGQFLFNIVAGADTADTMSAFLRTLGNIRAFGGVTRGPDYSVNLATAPLLLQSYNDPATPYSGVATMRDAVHGSVISVGGGDHGLFRRGEQTVDTAVRQFLADGTVTATTAPQAPLGKDGKYLNTGDAAVPTATHVTAEKDSDSATVGTKQSVPAGEEEQDLSSDSTGSVVSSVPEIDSVGVAAESSAASTATPPAQASASDSSRSGHATVIRDVSTNHDADGSPATTPKEPKEQASSPTTDQATSSSDSADTVRTSTDGTDSTDTTSAHSDS